MPGCLFRLLGGAIAGLVSSAALAQSANYTSVETATGKVLQLTYHASAHKDCTPGRLPTVRVIEPPTSGMLTVKVAELKTSRIAGCPLLKTPARVVFYQSREGYTGPDRAKYEVTSENGEVATYDTTITVKSAPAPSQPNPEPGTRGLWASEPESGLSIGLGHAEEHCSCGGEAGRNHRLCAGSLLWRDLSSKPAELAQLHSYRSKEPLPDLGADAERRHAIGGAWMHPLSRRWLVLAEHVEMFNSRAPLIVLLLCADHIPWGWFSILLRLAISGLERPLSIGCFDFIDGGSHAPYRFRLCNCCHGRHNHRSLSVGPFRDHEFGGLKDRASKRLKDLELENSRLRKAVSDLTLDKLILQEAARGSF